MSTAYQEEANLGVLRHIVSGERILDIGCGRGRLGQEMKARGNVVHGVELDADSAAVARSRLDLVHCGDVTDLGGLPAEIRRGEYDTLVLADILEHLVDPAAFLGRVGGLLRQGGRIVVSLPNVASWPTRLRLMAGDFTYGDSGVLDRTHLRFFTRKTARGLLQAAGFRTVTEDVTPYLARTVLPLVKKLGGRSADEGKHLVDSPMYRLYARWVEPIETTVARLHPGLLAFQFVLVGIRATD